METKPKKMEAVELIVYSIEAQEMQGKEQAISKVIFATDKGNISFKPKMVKEEFKEGIKVKSVLSYCYFSDLPSIIKNIATRININSKAKVKASFMVWEQEVAGVPTAYKYVQGNKMMESWTLEKFEENVTNQ